VQLWQVYRCCEHTFIANTLAPQAVVIDLGMNTGEFATYMVERFACSVYGAEPDPSLYIRLLQQTAVKIIPCAVDGRRRTAVLRRAAGKCSSLLDGGFAVESQLEVEALGFEEFLSRAGLAERDRIDLVKVDIEGAELSMFEEAPAALLQRVGQFSVEFHDFIWPELSHRVRCVKSRLRSLGFRVINFSRDNTDVLFVNRELLDLGTSGEAYLKAVKYAKGIQRKLGQLLPASRQES
jgi:FkbM family methyltransferase